MTTVFGPSDTGRRDVLRRPQGVTYGADTIEQQAGERSQMVSKSILVERDVSVLGMLRLDDTDNILISREESIWKYHEMLLGRLAKADKRTVRIHLRPHLLNADVERYAPFVAEGLDLTLWDGEASASLRRQDALTMVRVKPEKRVRAEGYLVIRTPGSSRILAAWHDNEGNTVGVLVTNPQTVERVCDLLDAIVQSATL